MKDDKPADIAVRGLEKRFDGVQAVAQVSFNVDSGELFGFLGPNGAGKTTTINMLTGLARLDSGAIKIGDIDCTVNPRVAQHLVGAVPDESNLHREGTTVFCVFLFAASLWNIKRRWIL